MDLQPKGVGRPTPSTPPWLRACMTCNQCEFYDLCDLCILWSVPLSRFLSTWWHKFHCNVLRILLCKDSIKTFHFFTYIFFVWRVTWTVIWCPLPLNLNLAHATEKQFQLKYCDMCRFMSIVSHHEYCIMIHIKSWVGCIVTALVHSVHQFLIRHCLL